MTLNDIRHSVTPKICQQTKFGIPISNNLGFMLVTRFFLDLRAYVKVGYATTDSSRNHLVPKLILLDRSSLSILLKSKAEKE